MKIFSIEIDGQNYNYVLLHLKDGQKVKTKTGDYLQDAVMGIVSFDTMTELTDIRANMGLSVFKFSDKYECHLKGEAFCGSEQDFPLQFGTGSDVVPVNFLDMCKRNGNWLFGLEVMEMFLRTLLALPDGEGGTFGDRWEIVNV